MPAKKATLVVPVLQARQLLLVILIPRPLLLAVMAQHLLGGAGDLLRRLVLPAMTPRRPCRCVFLHAASIKPPSSPAPVRSFFLAR